MAGAQNSGGHLEVKISCLFMPGYPGMKEQGQGSAALYHFIMVLTNEKNKLFVCLRMNGGNLAEGGVCGLVSFLS